MMKIDTVSSPEMPGFCELGITPHSVEAPKDVIELRMKKILV